MNDFFYISFPIFYLNDEVTVFATVLFDFSGFPRNAGFWAKLEQMYLDSFTDLRFLDSPRE